MLNFVSSAPARSTCQRGRSVSTSLLCANVPINLPKTCQFFNLAFQHAKRGSNISTSPAKTRSNYSTIFQKKLYFSIMLNTCKYQKYLGNLSHETKNLNFEVCTISMMKNLINLKPLTSFSMEHVRLTEQLFR